VNTPPADNPHAPAQGTRGTLWKKMSGICDGNLIKLTAREEAFMRSDLSLSCALKRSRALTQHDLIKMRICSTNFIYPAI